MLSKRLIFTLSILLISTLTLACLQGALLAQSPPVPPAPEGYQNKQEKKTGRPLRQAEQWMPEEAVTKTKTDENDKQPISSKTALNKTTVNTLNRIKGKPKPKITPYRPAMTKDGYLLAMPGYRYHFPLDHASHPRFKTEWWYYTGHLKNDQGKRYGYELTFFRSGIPIKNRPVRSNWALKDIYAAHFAVTDINRNRFVVGERLNRNSPYENSGHAQADTRRFFVTNNTWETWKIKGKNAFWLKANMYEKGHQYQLALTLTPKKPPVIHGKDGVSQKASCVGCASHYYSMTQLLSEGTIWVDGKPEAVSGVSWMDREFGSNQLTSEQTGWDWFSVQLDNQTELMLYVLRNERKENGKLIQYLDPNSSGTLVFADGKAKHLKKDDFSIEATGQWESSETGAKYPMGWRIKIPAYQANLILTPDMTNQELVTQQSTKVAYWEGSNRVKGTFQKTAVQGQAYVEMTGYAQKFRQRI